MEVFNRIDRLKYWIELLQKDYGYNSDVTAMRWIELINRSSFIEDAEEYFLVCTLQSHITYRDTLSVDIFYIKKEYRNNPKYLLKIEKRINTLAKENKVKYIVQGSHTNERMASFLEKIGYKPFLMRKEI